MTEHVENLRTQDNAAKLQRCTHLSRHHIASHTSHKQVTESLVENQLDGNTGVSAAENGSKRALRGGDGFHTLQAAIGRHNFTIDEALKQVQ
jgi:hypothetical protein